MRFILAAIVIFTVIGAFADEGGPDWRQTDEPTPHHPDRPWVYYDAKSVLISGDIRRAWFKVDYRPHTRLDPSQSGRYLNQMQYQAAFDCSHGWERIEQYKIKYENGELEEKERSATAEWQPLTPDNPSYADMELICSWKKHFWE